MIVCRSLKASTELPSVALPLRSGTSTVAQITPSGSTQSDAERAGITGVTGPVGESPVPEPEAAPEAPVDVGFVAAILAELRKVVWPSRQQLFSESIAVILMVGLSAAAIAALDRFYRWVSLQVFS